jgi:glycosyltransferase involved in cell wall biosynthesis
MQGVETRVATYHSADFFRPLLEGAGVPMARFPKRSRMDPSLPLRLRRWLLQERPDVVHAFLLAPALWTWLAVRSLPADLRPVLVCAERCSMAMVPRWMHPLQRFVYSHSDAVTVNAMTSLEELHAELGIRRGLLHYLPNGIDPIAWDRAALHPAPLEVEPSGFHLAIVGRVDPQKNHPLLIDALGRIPERERRDWRVWMIGAETTGTGFADRLREDIRARGLEAAIRWVPPTPEIAPLLRRMDALVLPSHTEGFPNVVLEAMVLGLPSVATRVGDVTNMLVDGESGLLVDPEDPEALAKALLCLSRMPSDRRRAMGERGRRTVEERFRVDRVAGDYASLYRSLARERRARGRADVTAG